MRSLAPALKSCFRNLYQDLVGSDHPRFEFAKQLAKSGLQYDARRRAPTAHFLSLFPEAATMDVDLLPIRYGGSNISPLELYCLSAICMLRKPKRIFEIGTFDGATAYQLARCCPDSTVFTLDLAPEQVESINSSLVQSEIANVRGTGVGAPYRGTKEADRIVQLYGDSTRFDYHEFVGTMDVVFIDACHDYEFVRSDTETALKLIRPGGIVLWHDYAPYWPGVMLR